MTEPCEKMISDMRAIRDGILGGGMRPIEVESVTITLKRFKGLRQEADPVNFDKTFLIEDHAITCSVTTSVTGEGSRTVGVNDCKDVHAAVQAFTARANEVGAREIGIARELEAALV